MTEFKLSRRNLPYKVQVLKEIARGVLSARNYSVLLKHRLEIKRMKNYHYTNPDKVDHASGCYNKYQRKLVIRSLNGDCISDNSIYVWIHEIGHMVWFKDRRITKKRTKVHAKAFKNLEKRLWAKYKEEVKPRLAEIKDRCKGREANFRKVGTIRKLTSTQEKERKQTIEYKLEKVCELKKKWKTKEKRVNTALKKLTRKEKLYNTLLAKR